MDFQRDWNTTEWISKERIREGSLCEDRQIGMAKKGPLIVGNGKEVKDAML